MNRELRLLPDLVHEAALRCGDRPALCSAASPALHSFGEVEQRIRDGAGALRERGLAARERVLLAMEGRPEWPIAWFAILEAGGVVVPIPSNTAPNTAAAIAAHAQVRLAILSDATARMAPSLAGIPLLAIDDLQQKRADPVLASLAVSPDEVALLAFTSGSTTAPRAVELTHRNLLADLAALLSMRRAQPGDAFLSMLPPAHLFELVGGLLGPWACGARVVYAGSPLPNRIVAALRERKITHALAVPALLDALYQEILDGLVEEHMLEPARRQQPLADTVHWFAVELGTDVQQRIRGVVRERIGSTFTTVVVGGAAIDPDWAEVLRPLDIAMEVGYGLTEASPIVSVGRAGECPADSVGRPLPGIEVRIAGSGEILVRGPNVMKGYFQDPEGTRSALRDGWLHTGDHGHLDSDGCLFVTGRLKEVMVTSAGETLYPEEVEPCYESALFEEACVVGLRGPNGNDVPTLIVVKAAQTPHSEIETAFARLRAAAPLRCRVAGLCVLEQPLPRTALGKVRRRELAESLSK